MHQRLQPWAPEPAALGMQAATPCAGQALSSTEAERYRKVRGILVKRIKRGDAAVPMSIATFPFLHFASGHTYFTQSLQDRGAPAVIDGSNRPTHGGFTPVAVHTTFQFGDTAEFAWGKRSRLREKLLWKVDAPHYFAFSGDYSPGKGATEEGYGGFIQLTGVEELNAGLERELTPLRRPEASCADHTPPAPPHACTRPRVHACHMHARRTHARHVRTARTPRVQARDQARGGACLPRSEPRSVRRRLPNGPRQPQLPPPAGLVSAATGARRAGARPGDETQGDHAQALVLGRPLLEQHRGRPLPGSLSQAAPVALPLPVPPRRKSPLPFLAAASPLRPPAAPEAPHACSGLPPGPERSALTGLRPRQLCRLPNVGDVPACWPCRFDHLFDLDKWVHSDAPMREYSFLENAQARWPPPLGARVPAHLACRSVGRGVSFVSRPSCVC